MLDAFRRYLLPGLVFQSVVIGGGYATGRELIEFFHGAGPLGGLLGMAVAMTVWSLVLAASFELVRITGSYDYKSFFRVLLGRGWFLYEVAYVLLLVLVLAVIGAAAGEIVQDLAGVAPLWGTLLLIGVVGVLVYLGQDTVARALSGAAIAMIAAYAVMFTWALTAFGPQIAANFQAVPVEEGWFSDGIRYAGYNMAVIPAAFFCIRHHTRRRHAVVAGLLGGPLTMLPGIIFFSTMMAFWPEIGEQAVPALYVTQQLGSTAFHAAFEVVVLWTLAATGVGLLHALNERIAATMRETRGAMAGAWRPAIALGVMVISVFAADAVGLIGLIAKGYGILTWAFIAVLVVPVLTIGLLRIARAPDPAAS